MRKSEIQYVSTVAIEQARQWGRLIKAARLDRNLTQVLAAERARMSEYTWIKIEKGNVSVSFGAWLSALETMGLLEGIELPQMPEPPRQHRLRARESKASVAEYDF